MARAVGRGEEADKALGQFLRDQSQAAGLSARDIEQRFQDRADQELARIEAGLEAQVDPVSGMNYSKSHLDRLFKGATSPPSKRFVMMFLDITSSVSGVPPSLHRELCRKAEDLLGAARQHRMIRRRKECETASNVPAEPAVATLQVQLELERALRTEDRLRWALSDAQLLMSTLLQIIGTLRDVIADLDAKHIRALHAGVDLSITDSAPSQRIQALTHRAAAESQLTRVNERRILLESLWEQAHNNVHRLSRHPDVSEIATLPAGPAIPHRETPMAELPRQLALTDIAAALGKVEEVNVAEDRRANEWQRDIVPTADLLPVDEQAILIAATQLTDADSREAALRALAKNWAQSPETRDALVRLSTDDQSEIRKTATRHLAQDWPDDDTARQAVIAVTRDPDPKVQAVAVWVLTQAWRGDPAARDAVVALTIDDSEGTRETAVEGLAEGWAGDREAQEALFPLIHDRSRLVRETTLKVLLECWPGDVAVRDTLLGLVRADDIPVREVAAEGLCAGWPGDASVTAAFLQLQDDDAPLIRWAAERRMNQEGIPLGRSQRGKFQSVERGNSLDRRLLIASRVPYDFSTEEPLEAILALRRGIRFDPGINVVSGRNGSGKSVFLQALALQVGAVGSGDIRKFRYNPRFVLQLADNLELLWQRRPLAKECFYLNPKSPERRRLEHLEAALSESSNFSLFILDEPMGAFDMGAAHPLAERISELAQRGCQFVIATSDMKRIEFTDCQFIRLGRRRIRDRGNILSW